MADAEFSVDDLMNLKIPGDARVSPGGDCIAYVVAENGAPEGQRSPESRIWLAEVGRERQGRQATFGPGTDRGPRWSPARDHLAFLSDREKRGTFQLYLLGQFPSEARKLTDLKEGAGNHAWSPDGNRLAVTSTDHVDTSENDVKLFDAERRFQRLYLIDVDSGETTPIDHGDLHVWEHCWSPDGCSIAAIVSDEPYQWGWYDARLVTIDVESGDVTTQYAPDRQIARPAWSPDGSCIALISCRWSDPGMTGGDIVTVDVAGGGVRNLTGGESRSHLTAHWLPGGDGLISFAWDHARIQVCRVDPDKGSRPLWTAEKGVHDYGGTFSPSAGRVATVLSSVNEPPEVWTGQIPSGGESLEMAALTTINPPEGYPEVRTDWMTWKSSDGREIEGPYLSTSAAPAGEPRPMVTIIHGGPTAAATSIFPVAGALAWSVPLLQQGYAIFLPNYRGSNGYGVEFAEANLGDLGGLDLQDVLTGVEACIEQGNADPERLGIGGWSYGGYLTSLAITRTQRFSAAVAGATIGNWYSFHGGTNIPGFASQFVGAPPYELDSAYAWTSPLFASKDVRTPTLLLHGENDPCCPVGQAYELTRALRRCGVEVECAVYPREPHGFVEREHRRDMINRAVTWFSTYLTGQ